MASEVEKHENRVPISIQHGGSVNGKGSPVDRFVGQRLAAEDGDGGRRRRTATEDGDGGRRRRRDAVTIRNRRLTKSDPPPPAPHRIPSFADAIDAVVDTHSPVSDDFPRVPFLFSFGSPPSGITSWCRRHLAPRSLHRSPVIFSTKKVGNQFFF